MHILEFLILGFESEQKNFFVIVYISTALLCLCVVFAFLMVRFSKIYKYDNCFLFCSGIGFEITSLE